jgi:ornithine cyclodeaminase/alanine dehydrogenase-like protein (mu-crystallin family)
MIGAGFQAETQLLALCQVRPIQKSSSSAERLNEGKLLPEG